MDRSEEKTDIWGDPYTQHYDDDGNKSGWSESKTDFWGDSYIQHHDNESNKSGWSEDKTDVWGDNYTQHHDNESNKSGWSEGKTDIWGDKYTQHHDNESNKSGWSEGKTDIWGDRYTQHHNSNGGGSVASRAYNGTVGNQQGSENRSRRSHSGGESQGTGFGGLFAVALLGGLVLYGFASSNQTPSEAIPTYAIDQSFVPEPNTETLASIFETSFDCSLADSWVLNTICTTETIAVADREMADIYGRLMRDANSDAQSLRKDQRLWLRDRDNCTEAFCLEAAYENRIQFLRSWVSPAISQPIIEAPVSKAETQQLPQTEPDYPILCIMPDGEQQIAFLHTCKQNGGQIIDR